MELEFLEVKIETPKHSSVQAIVLKCLCQTHVLCYWIVDVFLISSNEQNVCENALCILGDIIIQMRATTKMSFYVMLPVVFRKQVAL